MQRENQTPDVLCMYGPAKDLLEQAKQREGWIPDAEQIKKLREGRSDKWGELLLRPKA